MKDNHWGHWWTEWMKWVFFERTTQRIYTITGLQSSGFPHQLKWFYSLSVLAVYTGYSSKGKKGSTEARWRTKDQTAGKRDVGGVSLLTVPPPNGGLTGLSTSQRAAFACSFTDYTLQTCSWLSRLVLLTLVHVACVFCAPSALHEMGAVAVCGDYLELAELSVVSTEFLEHKL